MQVVLKQGPEGSPNFCFGLYAVRYQEGYKPGECVEFVQSDWDYAGLASSLGWQSCKCGSTDGTVDCEHKTATAMLSEAFDYLAERDGQRFNYDAA